MCAYIWRGSRLWAPEPAPRARAFSISAEGSIQKALYSVFLFPYLLISALCDLSHDINTTSGSLVEPSRSSVLISMLLVSRKEICLQLREVGFHTISHLSTDQTQWTLKALNFLNCGQAVCLQVLTCNKQTPSWLCCLLEAQPAFMPDWQTPWKTGSTRALLTQQCPNWNKQMLNFGGRFCQSLRLSGTNIDIGQPGGLIALLIHSLETTPGNRHRFLSYGKQS